MRVVNAIKCTVLAYLETPRGRLEWVEADESLLGGGVVWYLRNVHKQQVECRYESRSECIADAERCNAVIKAKRFRLWWVSADGQGCLDGGTYATEEDARKAIPSFRDELLAQCADDEHRQAILAGSFSIEEVDED